MPIPRLRLRTALLTLALCAASVSFAQSATDLLDQAKKAYDGKQYAQSADLYLKANDAKANPIALYNAACSFALAGKSDDAFRTLERLAQIKYSNATQIKQDTDLDSLHADPRWAPLIARFEEFERQNPPRKPFRPPYRFVPAAGEANAFASHLKEGETAAVWLDGDLLTFVYRGKAKSVELTGGLDTQMKNLDGTDLWVVQAKMDGWDKAIVTYAFLIDDSVTGFKLNTWRGANAPALPARSEQLHGQLIDRTIHSDTLNEDRKIHVYLPPNAPKSLPVFYLADGESSRSYAQVLEPLIEAGKVRPCAIVGIDSGGYRGERQGGYDETKDFRAKEYINGLDTDRFDRHLKFFTEEVPHYVEKEFGISSRREDKAVTGFSNGGAFSAALAYRKPNLYGAALPMSLGIPPDIDMPEKGLPKMFFVAGTLESFNVSTQKVQGEVKRKYPDTRMDLYVAGHDPTMWQLAFAADAPYVFPPKS